MKNEEPSHRDKGLSSILSKPWIYDLFANLIWKKNAQAKLVQDYIRPFSGCRILDIGCGTASILSYLPYSIGEYTGFDMNPSYIETAKKRWKNRANCKFFCQKVEDATTVETGYYDIVLAFAVIHHLSDKEARYLFNIANHALKLNGALITLDNVYVENQHWFAKWIISRDRGRAVRTVEGYTQIGAMYFTDIEQDLRHHDLKFPYSLFIMRCMKGGIKN